MAPNGNDGARRLAWPGWLAFASILAGTAALVLYGLGEPSLLGDEITVAYIGPESIGEILRLTFVDIVDPAYGRNRPLFNLLVHASMRVVDDLETATRLPSAIAAVLCVAALFRWTRKVAGVRVALVAAALFGGSHALVWAGRSATAYAWMLLCVILALEAATDALATDRRGPWIRLGAACALGYYFHPVMAFASLPILGGALLARWAPARLSGRVSPDPAGGGRGRNTLACLATGTVLMLPALWCIGWLLWWSYGVAPEAAPYDPHFMNTGRPVVSFEHEEYRLVREILAFLGPGSVAGFALVGALALLGIAASFRGSARPFAWVALATIAVPVTLLATVPFAHGFGARYLIFLLPVIVAAAARGLVAALAALTSRAPASASTALLLVATLALVAANAPHWYRRDPRVPARDWRTIASELEARSDAETLVLVSSGGLDHATPDPAGRRELGLYLSAPERVTTCSAGALATAVFDEARADLTDDTVLCGLILDGEQAPFEPWTGDDALEVTPLPGGYLLSFQGGSEPVFERLARLLIALARSGASLPDAGAMMGRAFDALWDLPGGCPSLELFEAITSWDAELDPVDAIPFRVSFAERLLAMDRRLGACPPEVRVTLARYPRERQTELSNACARAALIALEDGAYEAAVDFALRARRLDGSTERALAQVAEACRAAGADGAAERAEAALGAGGSH